MKLDRFDYSQLGYGRGASNQCFSVAEERKIYRRNEREHQRDQRNNRPEVITDRRRVAQLETIAEAYTAGLLTREQAEEMTSKV